MVPSIADYELRREYLRRHSAGALRELDAIARRLDVPPISDAVLRRAAALWAQSRQSGRPTSDPKALDNDCILVAQSRLEAEALYLRDDEWTIATSDVGDLPFLAPAALWRDVIRDLPSI
jgi:predicted nucleic acid-binding protein